MFAAVSGNDFLVWGWRVPFLLSALLIVVGMVIRLKVAETPAFQRLEAAGEQRRVPLLDVLKNNPRAVVLGLLATTSFYVCQSMTTVWGVSVAVESGADKNGVLNIKAVAALLTLVICFYSARLSDRIGRRRVLIGASLLGAVLVYPILVLMSNGELWGFAAAIILGNGLVQGFLYGPIAAYVAEQFPTRNRYTGASLAYQGASMIGAGFTPMIVAGLSLAMRRWNLAHRGLLDCRHAGIGHRREGHARRHPTRTRLTASLAAGIPATQSAPSRYSVRGLTL